MVAPTPMPALAPVLRPSDAGAESIYCGRLDDEPVTGVVQGEPGPGAGVKSPPMRLASDTDTHRALGIWTDLCTPRRRTALRPLRVLKIGH